MCVCVTGEEGERLKNNSMYLITPFHFVYTALILDNGGTYAHSFFFLGN